MCVAIRASLLSICLLASAALLQTTAASGELAGKIKIAFIGDSLAENYWDGVARLVDEDSCLKARLEILRLSKDSTGLLRPGRYDWPSEVKRIYNRIKPQMFVLSIGTNDEGSDDKYRDSILALLDSVKRTEAALLWIGLPVMRDRARDRDARAKNNLFEEAITGYGERKIEFVVPWKAKGEEDKFSSYGPDRNQSMVQIRLADGVHFTFAGDLVTGAYLLPKILSRIEHDGSAICGKTEAQAK